MHTCIRGTMVPIAALALLMSASAAHAESATSKSTTITSGQQSEAASQSPTRSRRLVDCEGYASLG